MVVLAHNHKNSFHQRIARYTCRWDYIILNLFRVIFFTVKVYIGMSAWNLDFRISAKAVISNQGGTLGRNNIYNHANVSAEGTIVNITFSVSLCPVELLWSSISLWKINFILHSWQIHIAFRSSGCIGSIMNFRSSNIMINQSSSWFLFKQITSNLGMMLLSSSYAYV